MAMTAYKARKQKKYWVKFFVQFNFPKFLPPW